MLSFFIGTVGRCLCDMDGFEKHPESNTCVPIPSEILEGFEKDDATTETIELVV